MITVTIIGNSAHGNSRSFIWLDNVDWARNLINVMDV